MDSTICFEVLVHVRVLLGYVLRNHVVGHVAGATAEISAGPQVSAPKLLLQARKLRQQVVRSSALQPLHQAADCDLRRQRDQQVHVILRHVSLHDRYFMLPADIPDQIPYPRRDLPRQCRSSVLRDPHQMQVNFEYSVRTPPVFRHPRSLSGAHALKAVA